MPEYLAPGVYIEEIEVGAKPIEGVSTSTAGFLGETERGPTLPQLVTSWLQYQRMFGSYLGETKYLPYTVEGFFNNGGQRCFLGRIVKSGSQGATLGLTKDAADVITVDAVGEGTWGNRVLIKLAPGTFGSSFKLSVFYWKQALPTPLYDPEVELRRTPRPTVVEVYDNLSVDEGSPDYYKKRINGISALITVTKKGTGAAPELGHIAAPETATAPNITLTPAPGVASAVLDAYKGMQIDITAGPGKGQSRLITGYNGGSRVATVDPPWPAAPDLPTATSTYRLSWPLRPLAGGRDFLIENGAPQAPAAGSTIRLAASAADADDFYKGMRIDIINGPGSGQSRTITGYLGSTRTATVDSAWPVAPDLPTPASTYRVTDITPLRVGDYERTDSPDPGTRKGLTGFTEIEDISIVYAPDAQSINGLPAALINHCELLRNRFAIIDSTRGHAKIDTINPRSSTLPPNAARDTKYAAFYYPWIKVVDPEAGVVRLVPPGGHVAGIYARSDTERGVHKAPANEVVRGAVDLEFQITKGEQGILNPKGVNAIRQFPGRGIYVWGARTLSTDTLWKYINIRRLFIFLEGSIDRGTQWVVFEPNNEQLWDRVKLTISEFLTRVWRDGALMGTKQEEAFFVKADRSTMTQDDIDNGRLIVLIGVAPVKPAEFVIFRIFQMTAAKQ